MSPLNNPRHEHFASLVSGGMTATQAYLAAGFSGKGAAQSASRLAKEATVRARISELQSRASSAAATRAAVDREWVLSGLRKIAETAESESARVRAYELCGKELGMFDPPEDDEVWNGDLESLTAVQLTKLSEQLGRIAFGSDQAAIEADETQAALKIGHGAEHK